RQLRWMAWSVYAGSAITLVIVFLPIAALGGPGPGVYLGANPVVILNLGKLALLPTAAATMVNVRVGTREGRGPRVRTVWLAALCGALAMVYAAISSLVSPYAPRAVIDWLVVVAMLMVGTAVARHQAFVERRTTLQDLPVSVLIVV